MKSPEHNVEHFKLTEKEFSLWLNPFRYGQDIFDKHVGNTDPITPMHLVPSYNGRKDIICYVEEEDSIVVSFKLVKDLVTAIKKNNHNSRLRRTNAHLIRLGMCTTPDLIPIFSGIEERAHAYFHKHIKPKLKLSDVSHTGRYDGSDSSEEYAFVEISKIILKNKDLSLYPLPDNFHIPIK